MNHFRTSSSKSRNVLGNTRCKIERHSASTRSERLSETRKVGNLPSLELSFTNGLGNGMNYLKLSNLQNMEYISIPFQNDCWKITLRSHRLNIFGKCYDNSLKFWNIIVTFLPFFNFEILSFQWLTVGFYFEIISILKPTFWEDIFTKMNFKYARFQCWWWCLEALIPRSVPLCCIRHSARRRSPPSTSTTGSCDSTRVRPSSSRSTPSNSMSTVRRFRRYANVLNDWKYHNLKFYCRNLLSREKLKEQNDNLNNLTSFPRCLSSRFPTLFLFSSCSTVR